jgi:CheY-like chemotaxis protein
MFAGPDGVGFARHVPAYDTDEAELAQRTADTTGAHRSTEAEREGWPGPAQFLAIEDHPVMQLGVRALLEREGRHRWGLTSTCSEAIGLLGEAQPDVILCDLHLPDADGAEAVARIRAEAPALPIVAFSIDRQPDLVRAVIRAGGNGYVSKDTSGRPRHRGAARRRRRTRPARRVRPPSPSPSGSDEARAQERAPR